MGVRVSKRKILNGRRGRFISLEIPEGFRAEARPRSILEILFGAGMQRGLEGAETQGVGPAVLRQLWSRTVRCDCGGGRGIGARVEAGAWLAEARAGLVEG